MKSSSMVLIGVGGALLAAAAVVGAAAASPYVAVNRLKEALLAGDEEEIRDRVDFPKLREALKEDAAEFVLENAKADAENGDPMAAVGAAFAGSITERVVDAYVTPKWLAEVARSGKRGDADDEGVARTAGAEAPKLAWALRYRKWSQCVVDVREPGADTGLALYLGRRGLFSWQLERIAFIEKPKRPTDARILGALGGRYSPPRKAALCRLPAAVPQSSFFPPGARVWTRVVGVYELGEGDSARLLALVSSVPADIGGYACHACSVLVGGVQYSLVGGRWKAESADLAVTESGASGELGAEPKVVEIGKGRYGLVLEGSDVAQGVEMDYARLLGLRGGRLRDLGGVGYQVEDASGIGRCRQGTSTSPSSWRIDGASGGEFYDLLVEHGAEVCEDFETNAKRTLSPAWTERWTFSGDAYKSTNPRN